MIYQIGIAYICDGATEDKACHAVKTKDIFTEWSEPIDATRPVMVISFATYNVLLSLFLHFFHVFQKKTGIEKKRRLLQCLKNP